MPPPIIRSNYDVVVQVRIRSDGANENLSAATIKASLVNADKSAELIADTVQSSDATGAAWASGLVVVEFSLAQTSALVPGSAFIELAITNGGKRTPTNSIPVTIEKGWTVS